MDDGRRMGRLMYVVLVTGIFVAQVYALRAFSDENIAFGAAIAAVLQALKLVPSRWRLRDLARPADDLFWAFVPGANYLLFCVLALQIPPSGALRERRLRAHSGQLTAVQAFRMAWPWLVASAPVVVPMLLVDAALHAITIKGAMGWVVVGRDASVAVSLLTGSALLLTVYTTLQVAKRRTASRASWWPSLLLFPSLLAAGGVSLAAQGSQDTGLIAIGLIGQALDLVWYSLAGAALVTWMLLAGDAARRGERASIGALWAQTRGRLFGVAAVHGARVLIVALGLQVIVPGIYYAVQYAFTDALAVLDPDRPALRGSSDLTAGIRDKVLKVFGWAFVLSTIVGTGMYFGVLGTERATAAFVDPLEGPTSMLVAYNAVSNLAWWWVSLALLALYHERKALRDRRDAARAQAAS